MMKQEDPIVVVGAGPVGALLTLALARKNFPVVLIEAEREAVKDMRAATVHPPTIEMLAELGLKDEAWDGGLLSPVFHYRDRVTGELVAAFDVAVLEGEVPYPFVLQWEQYKLVRVILKQLAEMDHVDVRFGTRLVGLAQSDDDVALQVEVDGALETLRASYVVGTDGGRSTVRRLADIEFEGFTWPERFIKIGTTFQFTEADPGLCTRNYFSDPTEWLNLFMVKGEEGPGIWRGIFPVRPGESDEDAMSTDGVQQRLNRFLPREGGYEIAYHALYSVHQRVAATFNKGRVLLAGDSAHVNNPIGGMGMNGGIHDAVNLAAKLDDVRAGRAASDVLDRYTRQRRKAQVDFVQAQSVANKRALSETDPAKRREHLDGLRRVAEDRDLHKKFLYKSSLIDSLNAANAVM